MTHSTEHIELPRELAVRITNALGFPPDESHTRLRAEMLALLLAEPVAPLAQERSSFRMGGCPACGRSDCVARQCVDPALHEAARNLIAGIHDQLQTKPLPQKFGIPFGLVNDLNTALSGQQLPCKHEYIAVPLKAGLLSSPLKAVCRFCGLEPTAGADKLHTN